MRWAAFAAVILFGLSAAILADASWRTHAPVYATVAVIVAIWGLITTGWTFSAAAAGPSWLRRRRAGGPPAAYRVENDDDGDGDGDGDEKSEPEHAPRDPASVAEILTPVMRERVTLWLQRLGVPSRDLEDLVQEVLLTAYLLFDPAKVGDTGAPGLVNLIARRAADHYHRKVRHSREEVLDLSMLGREDVEGPSIEVPLVEEQGPEHHLLRREAALQVQAILQALSPEDRRLLAAIFLRELQVKDYAAKYDIELHTAYRERDRALERARALAARVLRVFGRKAR